MKKTLIFIVSVITLFTLTGCSIRDLLSENKTTEPEGKITITIKEETLTNKGATFIIKNNTNESFYYGLEFTIEKKIDEEWQELQMINEVYYAAVAETLAGNAQIEVKKDWEMEYGKLPSGEYRLVMDFLSETENIYIESNFTLS